MRASGKRRWPSLVGLGAAAAMALLAVLRFGGREIDRIVAAEFEPARSGWIEGTWRRGWSRRSVWLRRRGGASPFQPWVAFDLSRERGGEPYASLVIASDAALLPYHVASRADGIANGDLLPNRLAKIGRVEEGDFRLALVFEPPLPGPHPATAFSDLPAGDAARLIALAEALGAWELLANDRLPIGAGRRPRLPFFVPRARDDLRILVTTGSEAFLPATLARRVVTEPGLRERVNARLFAVAMRLPELAASVERVARSPALRGLEPEIAEVRPRLATTAAAYAGHLRSVWAECVIAVPGPDAAEVALYLHSVVPVALKGFEAKLPGDADLADAARGLRLRHGGASIAAAVDAGRLRFPMDTRIEPIPHDTVRFETAQLAFTLVGLERFGEVPWELLDAIEPRLVNLVTGERVPSDHVTGFASDRDPRFGHGAEEGAEAFLDALPRRLVREGPGGSARVDPRSRRLVVAGGRYRVAEDLILPVGLGLVLEAGVELRIAPGRSILVRGPLVVRGEAQAPVVVRGASRDEPWGTFAVQGRGASVPGADPPRPRVEIRQLVLEGGAGDHLGGTEYTGQLSVHHADLELEQATLRDARGKDALSVRHTRFAIRDARIVDNEADGIDLDRSRGSIRGTLFAGGRRGDGLEISRSDVSVEDSVFRRDGRRCLTAQEEASVRLRGSLLRGCKVGITSRDDARVDVRESLFLANVRDFAAAREKEVFGGGRIHAEDLILADTRSGDRLDDLSQIEVEAAIRVGAEGARALLGPLAAPDRFSTQTYRRLRRGLTQGSP